ncbi:zinc-ribbon domain-containing protein [Pedobacter sp. ASV1-7]|uniref:zinc ribbon domain-containing protein n=1 Tax=Pedobacter sp. ASV1-7 TaxID=3145237 RepID=UPI0032E87FDC
MNCTKCNTPNAEEAKFCKNCGTNIVPYQSDEKTSEQSIRALLIIIGIEYFFSAIMFLIQKFIFSSALSNGNGENIDLIYKTYGWTSDIVSLAAILYFMVTLTNNKVKTALVIFFILRVIFMIGYRAVPFFDLL